MYNIMTLSNLNLRTWCSSLSFLKCIITVMKLRHKPFRLKNWTSMQYCAVCYYPMLICKQEKEPMHVCTTQAMSWLSELPARNRLSPLLQYDEQCPSAVWYKNLINHNWASIKSTLFHGMPFFSMITTHKAQVWILNARCKCIFPNIKYFDDKASSRRKLQ